MAQEIVENDRESNQSLQYEQYCHRWRLSQNTRNKLKIVNEEEEIDDEEPALIPPIPPKLNRSVSGYPLVNNNDNNTPPPTAPQLRYCVSAPILRAVTSSVNSGLSSKMDDETTSAARLYYEMIANNTNLTFDKKKRFNL
eukprot:181918_1